MTKNNFCIKTIKMIWNSKLVHFMDKNILVKNFNNLFYYN